MVAMRPPVRQVATTSPGVRLRTYQQQQQRQQQQKKQAAPQPGQRRQHGSRGLLCGRVRERLEEKRGAAAPRRAVRHHLHRGLRPQRPRPRAGDELQRQQERPERGLREILLGLDAAAADALPPHHPLLLDDAAHASGDGDGHLVRLHRGLQQHRGVDRRVRGRRRRPHGQVHHQGQLQEGRLPLERPRHLGTLLHPGILRAHHRRGDRARGFLAADEAGAGAEPAVRGPQRHSDSLGVDVHLHLRLLPSHHSQVARDPVRRRGVVPHVPQLVSTSLVHGSQRTEITSSKMTHYMSVKLTMLFLSYSLFAEKVIMYRTSVSQSPPPPPPPHSLSAAVPKIARGNLR